MTDKEFEVFCDECESRAVAMLKELLDRYVSNGNKEFEIGIKVEADYKDWENYFLDITDFSDCGNRLYYGPPEFCGSDYHKRTEKDWESWKECMKTWILQNLHELVENNCEGKKVLCINRSVGLRTLSLEWLYWILVGEGRGFPKNYKFVCIDSSVETKPLSFRDLIVYDDANHMFKLKEDSND